MDSSRGFTCFPPQGTEFLSPGSLLTGGKRVPSSIAYLQGLAGLPCAGLAQLGHGPGTYHHPLEQHPQPPAPCSSYPEAGTAPAPPLLPLLPAPLALPIQMLHPLSHPAHTLPSSTVLGPRVPPSPRGIIIWVTFSSQLLEAPPCPLPLHLELEGSFICHCLF